MAAGDPILDLSDLVNLATGGGGGTPEQINIFKGAFVGGAAGGTHVAGRITSLWQRDGNPSGAGTTAPTTSTVLTNASSGALKQTTPGSGKKKRLLSIALVALNAGSVIVYDRLVHTGGLSGTVTTAQTTNLPTSALTRRTTGVGVEHWLEIYTQIGATGTTVATSYTDDAGNTGNTSPLVSFGNTGFREAQRQVPLPVAVGDRGVRAVASVTLTATTGTAGAFGVTLAYPLCIIPVPVAGIGNMWSGVLQAGGPLDLGADSDACIAMSWHPNTTTATEIFGHAFFIEK